MSGILPNHHLLLYNKMFINLQKKVQLFSNMPLAPAFYTDRKAWIRAVADRLSTLNQVNSINTAYYFAKLVKEHLTTKEMMVFVNEQGRYQKDLYDKSDASLPRSAVLELVLDCTEMGEALLGRYLQNGWMSGDVRIPSLAHQKQATSHLYKIVTVVEK